MPPQTPSESVRSESELESVAEIRVSTVCDDDPDPLESEVEDDVSVEPDSGEDDDSFVSALSTATILQRWETKTPCKCRQRINALPFTRKSRFQESSTLAIRI